MTAHLAGLLLALAVWAAGHRRIRELPLWLAAGALWVPWLPLAMAVARLALFLGRRAILPLREAVQRDAVRRAVPGLLTDLAMAAEAGQPLHLALRNAHRYDDGPLAEALGRFSVHIEQGWSVGAALEHLQTDLGTEETDRLIALLARDVQLGLPLRDSVARYRRNWLGAARRDAQRTGAYLPYVFTAIAGVLLLEGVGLLAMPWFMNLWHML